MSPNVCHSIDLFPIFVWTGKIRAKDSIYYIQEEFFLRNTLLFLSLFLDLKSCKNDTFMSDLPKASVIMCFHNEAWSVLVRGLHSIYTRTPAHLLEEVLLVDDFSDFDYLFEPLVAYLNDHFGDKIRVIRNAKREGLIRSRCVFTFLISNFLIQFFLDGCFFFKCEGYLVHAKLGVKF